MLSWVYWLFRVSELFGNHWLHFCRVYHFPQLEHFPLLLFIYKCFWKHMLWWLSPKFSLLSCLLALHLPLPLLIFFSRMQIQCVSLCFDRHCLCCNYLSTKEATAVSIVLCIQFKYIYKCIGTPFYVTKIASDCFQIIENL